MWGLDTMPPGAAIEAMQAMNASVRNAVFAPAFFATPFLSLLVAIWAWRAGLSGAAAWFMLAGLVYLGGGLVLTMTVNVSMNEALAVAQVPADAGGQAAMWTEYSGPWQFWNQTRTVFSGIALLFSGLGLLRLAG